MLPLGQLCTDDDANNDDDNDGNTNNDDNNTQWTNQDCIGSLACMPNEPKTISASKLRSFQSKILFHNFVTLSNLFLIIFFTFMTLPVSFNISQDHIDQSLTLMCLLSL